MGEHRASRVKTGITHQTPVWPQPHQPQWPIAQSHPRPMQLITIEASRTLKRLFSHETDSSDDAPISIVIWFRLQDWSCAGVSLAASTHN
jgi:hypothetical protein